MTDQEWLGLALAPTCEEEREAVNNGPEDKGLLITLEGER